LATPRLESKILRIWRVRYFEFVQTGDVEKVDVFIQRVSDAAIALSAIVVMATTSFT